MLMKTVLPPDYDLKEEIVRMLHPKWHFVRAHYLVTDLRLSLQEVGAILSRCAGPRWPKDHAYKPSTVREYVRQGYVEVRYFRSPLWRLDPRSRAYLERQAKIDLAEDGAIDLVRAFVGMYSVRARPRGCGPKIWKDIVDAIE